MEDVVETYKNSFDLVTTSPDVRSCTSLDHIYKVGLWTDKVQPGQKCLCGKRQWGIETGPEPQARGQ
jgi:hypothetical protein